MLSKIIFGGVLSFALAKQATVELNTIHYSDLVSLDETSRLTISNSLVTIGALQIVDIPNFKLLRKSALESLPECLAKADSRVSKEMADGSLRLTAQSASVHGVSGQMSTGCGDSSAKLRAVVDATTRQLFLALDKARADVGNLNQESPLMTPYRSYDDLMHKGEHLEHLHAYFSAPIAGSDSGASTQSVGPNTIDYHTDAGLLIAMTTGYFSGGEASEDSGLFIQLPTGAKARAVVSDDALIIMVGDGGARWLAPVLGAPLRAVPHALVADLKRGSGVTRSWYGKMYLPPNDAVMPQDGVTFQQYQTAQSRALARIASQLRNILPTDQSEVLPSACGGVHSAYGLLSSSTECLASDGTDGIACWMTCMSVSSLSCGTNAVCTNPETGETNNGDTTCPTCVPECAIVPANATSFSGYCYGTGVSMYMQGFTSIIAEDKSTTACLNLLFTEWTLDSSVKFGFACFGVLLFGVFIQLLTKLRFDVAKRPTTVASNALLVALHTAQIVSGYFIMLIAMTYSVEMFCMVCLGLSIGFAMFNLKTPPSESTDPCCPPDAEEDSKRGLEAPLLRSKA